jgi:hypothetical protein
MPTNRDWPPYFSDPYAKNAFNVGKRIAEWITTTSFKAQAGFTERGALAAGAFRLAHEHHYAIVELFENGRSGSALALLRPCFEALAIGIWCRDLPAEREALITNFKESRLTMDPQILLVQCKNKVNKKNIEMLVKLWTISKKDLHGYAHGGYKLISSRYTAEDMPPLLAARAIRFATQTALQATHELAVTFDDAVTIKLVAGYFNDLGEPDPELRNLMEADDVD